MRGVALVLALTLGSAAPVPADESEIAGDLRRPTMPVADLDASVEFFTEVLGMTVSGRRPYNSPVLRAAIGAADDVDLIVVALDDKNQQGALVLVGAAGLRIDAAANRANATTLAWSVADIDAVYRRAVAGGYEVLMSPDQAAEAEDFPPEKEMILVEPSGHRLIIVQPPPPN